MRAFLFFLAISLALSASEWDWLGGGVIRSIESPAPGVLVTAEDGGRVRFIEDYGAVQTFLDTGDERNLHALCLLGADHAWVTGGMGGGCGNTAPDSLVDGTTLHTADAGANWTKLANPNLPDERMQWEAVGFVSPENGVVAGWQHGSQSGAPRCDVWTVNRVSAIYHTSDGGQNWNSALRFVGSDAWFTDVEFATAACGWASRTYASFGTDERLYRTLDGGASWTPVTTGLDTGLRGMVAVSASYAIAVGDQGHILRTVDGVNWSESPSPTTTKLMDVDARGNMAWAVGENGVILRSEDTGASWTQVTCPVPSKLRDVSAASESEVWAAGEFGAILLSLDGGLNWDIVEIAPAATSLYAVEAAPSGNVYAAGLYGKAVHSADEGESWTEITGLENTLKAIDFPSPSIGWIGGGMSDAAFLWKTEDGGNSWTAQDPGPRAVRALDIHDTLHGWALTSVDPYTTRPRRTVDGGTTWTNLGDLTTARGKDLRFLTEDLGFVAGERPPEYGAKGRVWRTTNGGANWATVHNEVDYDFIRFDVVDGEAGGLVAAIGYSWMVPPERALLVLSRDGGNTWEHALSVTGWAGDALVLRGSEIWVAGGGGRILYSQDNGQSWTPERSHATERIYSMSMNPESDAIYASGINGLLLRRAISPPTAVDLPMEAGQLRISSLMNPGKGKLRLRIFGASAGLCRMEIYDVQGRLQKSMEILRSREGGFDLLWDGKDAGGRNVSGVFLAKLRDGAGREASIKLTRLH
ncbi:MAG: YCF48-related protein [Candidatus Krumholzibacteria bacterium]|nr:YCF48-related protein [Candidatus Krumholzibacteria bacterium]